MADYIFIPKYFNSRSIYSQLLNEFFLDLSDKDYIDENKIDLDYLRKFYQYDKYKSIKVIKELKLRGFIFVEKNKTSFLDSFSIPEDYNKFIYTSSNTEKYKNINKVIFNYLDYSSINNDKYFNGIPLLGFKNYDQFIEDSLIENEFKSYGFEIITLENYLLNVQKNSYDFENLINELKTISNKNNKCFSDILNIDISPIFNKYKSSGIYSFTKSNKIFLLEDFIIKFKIIENYLERLEKNIY